MNRRVGNTRCRVSPDDRLSIPKRWLRFDGGDTIKTFSKAAQMGGYLERIKSSRCCVSERNQVSWVGWARAVCESQMGLGPKQGTAGALFATASSHDLALLMARLAARILSKQFADTHCLIEAELSPSAARQFSRFGGAV